MFLRKISYYVSIAAALRFVQRYYFYTDPDPPPTYTADPLLNLGATIWGKKQSHFRPYLGEKAKTFNFVTQKGKKPT